MSRFCEECGSGRLAVVKVFDGYWRKECLNCHSTGPFAPMRPDFDTRTPALQKLTDKPLADRVAAFCDEWMEQA